MNHGLVVKLNITEKDLDELVKSAHKNGCVYISVITPHNESARLTVRVERIKGFDCVEVNTHSCNQNINDDGQRYFMRLTTDWPEDIKDVHCGKCIMRISIKHDDERMWGVGLWLTRILKVLEKGEYLEQVKLS